MSAAPRLASSDAASFFWLNFDLRPFTGRRCRTTLVLGTLLVHMRASGIRIRRRAEPSAHAASRFRLASVPVVHYGLLTRIVTPSFRLARPSGDVCQINSLSAVLRNSTRFFPINVSQRCFFINLLFLISPTKLLAGTSCELNCELNTSLFKFAQSPRAPSELHAATVGRGSASHIKHKCNAHTSVYALCSAAAAEKHSMFPT